MDSRFLAQTLVMNGQPNVANIGNLIWPITILSQCRNVAMSQVDRIAILLNQLQRSKIDYKENRLNSAEPNEY